MNDNVKPDYFTQEAADLCAKLSPRELQTLILKGKGYSYKEVGKYMGISMTTVTDYLKHIYKKLGVHTSEEAVVIGTKAGHL